MELTKRTENEIKIADKYIDLIKSNKKISTIRPGLRFVTNDELTLTSEKRRIKVRFRRLDQTKTFEDITVGDVINNGFRTKEAFIKDIKQFYPDLKNEDRMTIIYFRYIPNSEENIEV